MVAVNYVVEIGTSQVSNFINNNCWTSIVISMIKPAGGIRLIINKIRSEKNVSLPTKINI